MWRLKRQIITLLVSCVIILICANCKPSADQVQTAIAETQAMEMAVPSLEKSATMTATKTATFTPFDTPTPTLTPTLVPAEVTAPRLNLRSGPSTEFSILSILFLGDNVFISGRNEDKDWVFVRTSEWTVGWVSAEYLEFTIEDIADLEIRFEVVQTPTPKK